MQTVDIRVEPFALLAVDRVLMTGPTFGIVDPASVDHPRRKLKSGGPCMGTRILLLGTTGVDKRSAVRALREYAAVETDLAGLEFHDFENKYIGPLVNGELWNYWDQDPSFQRYRFETAWTDFQRNFNPDAITVLAMHAVLVRETYGVRAQATVDSIREFQPTRIVTLIDDVYSQWARTEARASGMNHRGRPTLAQLLDGRAAELLHSDVLARHLNVGVENTLLAVLHPARTLYRLLFGSSALLTLYLSFPISRPRKLAATGDTSGIDSVNNFLRVAAEFESRHPQVACFCPLTIDELPFALLPDDATEFDPASSRWKLDAFWPGETLLGNPPAGSIQFDPAQRREAVGPIRRDVALRDYRLVTQSKRVVAFNPVMRGEKAAGVQNEIRLAVQAGRPVRIFQDPEEDPAGIAKADYLGVVGSLGRQPGSQLIQFFDSIDDALEASLI